MIKLLLMIVCGGALSLASVVTMTGDALGDESAQRNMIITWAGNYDTDAFLNEPRIRTALQSLLGSEWKHLMRNLTVRGPVDLIQNILSLSGNAPHEGTEEEAVVCVVPGTLAVEAAIMSKDTVTLFTRADSYFHTSLCIKDWITLANSKHMGRIRQPANVQMVRPTQ